LCVDLAERYITDREFPDKAFDIIDEVGARSQVEIKMPEIIDDLKKQASDIKQQKLDVVKKQNYEEAANLRDKEKKILSKLEDEKKKFESDLLLSKRDVTEELVYEVVSNMTKIPISKLNSDETKLLTELEKNLSGKVIAWNLDTNKAIKSVYTGKSARSLAISTDGSSLYVVNFRSGTVSKVSTSDMRVSQTIKVCSEPIGVTYDSSTSRTWVACYGGSIKVFENR
jgi:YVTN family beta-propeller protein